MISAASAGTQSFPKPSIRSRVAWSIARSAFRHAMSSERRQQIGYGIGFCAIIDIKSGHKR